MARMRVCEGYVEHPTASMIRRRFRPRPISAAQGFASQPIDPGWDRCSDTSRRSSRDPSKRARARSSPMNVKCGPVSATRSCRRQKARRHAACAANEKAQSLKDEAREQREMEDITTAWTRKTKHILEEISGGASERCHELAPGRRRRRLPARWTDGVLLKRDGFSTVERGRCRSTMPAKLVECVLRQARRGAVVCLFWHDICCARTRRASAWTATLTSDQKFFGQPESACARGLRWGRVHLAKPGATQVFPPRRTSVARSASRAPLSQRLGR